MDLGCPSGLSDPNVVRDTEEPPTAPIVQLTPCEMEKTRLAHRAAGCL